MAWNWQTGTQTADENVYHLWLIFDDDGGVRMTRKSPATGRGERAICVTLKVPRSIFRTPSFKATIKVADGDPSNHEINVEAMSEAIRQTLGVDVDVQVIPPPSPQSANPS